MHPTVYIAERQYSWARRHGVDIDEAGFAAILNDNLFLPLTAETVQEFQAGAGGELDHNMRAAHSSSALVVNVFFYWRLYNQLEPIISAICPNLVNYEVQGLRFEERCPINWPVQPQPGRIPPHLDVVIQFKDRPDSEITKAIAVESKFGELYTQNQGEFADCYLAHGNEAIWEGFEPLQGVANQIHQGDILFRRLKVAQLIKHILGLRAVYHETRNFELIYLWYPVFGPEAALHEDEIRRFQQIINDCNPRVKFRAITYHDLIFKLATDQGVQNGAYVDYLMERYF